MFKMVFWKQKRNFNINCMNRPEKPNSVQINYEIPGCFLTKTSCKLFPAKEGLVSDIPAGDRNVAKLFYSASSIYIHDCNSVDGLSAFPSTSCTEVYMYIRQTFLIF